MNKRVLLIVALLLLCALVSLQQDVDATIIETVGKSTKRTLTTDTDDVTFTVRFTGETGDNRALVLEAGGLKVNTNPLLTTVGLSTETLLVRADKTYDVTVTVARSEIPTVKDQINITFQGGDALEPSFLFQVSLTIAVRTPSDPVIDIELGVDGNATQYLSPSEIKDVTFTILIDSDSTGNERVDLAVATDDLGFYEGLDVDDATIESDIALVTLSRSSVNTKPDVTRKTVVTIPASLIKKYSGYFATVRGTSRTDKLFTSTVKVWVNVQSLTSGILIQGVDGLTQETETTATGDITYTLRVTNTGGSLDAIDLTVLSANLEDGTLSVETLTLFPDSFEDITLTIPRSSFGGQPGTYEASVVAASQNDSNIIASIVTTTTVTGEPLTPPEGTGETEGTEGTGGTEGTRESGPGEDETDITPIEKATHTVVFSEFMFVAGEDEIGLPQWIEVYNNSEAEVNLRGWKLQLKSLEPSPLDVTVPVAVDFIIPAQQARVIVTALGRHSGGGNLSDDAVFQLLPFPLTGLAQETLVNQIQYITGGGFSVKLRTSADVLVDHIGTLSGTKQAWELPECLIEGVRSSLIRRFDKRVPRAGIEKRGWIRAYDTKKLVAGVYYGSQHDIGTPGYRRGKPLPVELSQFSAKSVNDAVVISWTTESELDNAGFNIFRSTARTKNFQRINVRLIQGAGTTGQRTQYQFIDKSAKPDVAYYYRLEDVDLSGTRGILTTYRLRGVIAPTGKHITTWGTLKAHR